MKASPHLVVMAAGTGGHVMPGLAVAQEVRARGWSVSWLGTTHGMENRLVPPQTQSGIAMDRIVFSGLRGKGVLHALTGGLRLLKAFGDCLRILRARGADVVLGMGGYVCFPGGLMASLLGKPLMLVNADAELLLSTRALLPVADRVAFGFDGPGAARVRGALVTGNPVRASIQALPAPQQRFAGRQGPLRLLVVGGSLGARVLNDTVPAALAAMPASSRPQVLHQTGAAQVQGVREVYAAAAIPAEVSAFIDDMARALAEADVVLCRAGAVTVSELCAAGAASVLVPLVLGTTAHQRDNAQWMAAQGAALHLPQEQMSAAGLAQLLQSLDRARLLELAQRARALARPDAAARVADELAALLERR